MAPAAKIPAVLSGPFTSTTAATLELGAFAGRSRRRSRGRSFIQGRSGQKHLDTEMRHWCSPWQRGNAPLSAMVRMCFFSANDPRRTDGLRLIFNVDHDEQVQITWNTLRTGYGRRRKRWLPWSLWRRSTDKDGQRWMIVS